MRTFYVALTLNVGAITSRVNLVVPTTAGLSAYTLLAPAGPDNYNSSESIVHYYDDSLMQIVKLNK